MTKPHKIIVSDATLYRLVDGQMESDEYRQTLLALDQANDGWRRCAMAFLENQALEQELSKIDFAALDKEVPGSSDKLWAELMNGELSSELEPEIETRDENRDSNKSRSGRKLLTRVLLGTSVMVTCCLVTLSALSTKNSVSPDSDTSQFNTVENSNQIVAEVPVRDSSIAMDSKFLGDPSDLETVLPSSNYFVSDYESNMHRKYQDGNRYDMPVQTIRYSPQPTNHFR